MTTPGFTAEASKRNGVDLDRITFAVTAPGSPTKKRRENLICGNAGARPAAGDPTTRLERPRTL